MNLFLSFFIIVISIIGGVMIWYSFLYEGGIDFFVGIIWFFCIVIPGIVNDMYEDNLKTKYEIPNRKQEIVYEGKVFKKETFTADYKLKGFAISQIIFIIGVLPIVWSAISGLSVVFFEWIRSFF